MSKERVLTKFVSEDGTSSSTGKTTQGPRRPTKGLPIGRTRSPRNLGNGEVRQPPNNLRSFVSQPEGKYSRDDALTLQEDRELKVKARMGTLVLPDGQTHVVESLDNMADKQRIGCGISGEVFKMLHKPSNKRIAAKKMIWRHDNTEEQRRVLMDLEVMNSHHSPYIVEYYGSAIINNEVWVFMELMETCLDVLMNKITKRPIPEPYICKMCVPIVKALHYLKTEHRVIHRDVKPSNILVDRRGNVKLCDFGISGRLVDSKAFTRGAGCAAYMAPERISSSQMCGYDVRADVWSLGISLVELANGVSPYAGNKFKNEFELLTHIVQAPPPLLDKEKFSDNFYDFVALCLSKDVKERPLYPQLLTHPLITEYETRPIDIGEWLCTLLQESDGTGTGSGTGSGTGTGTD